MMVSVAASAVAGMVSSAQTSSAKASPSRSASFRAIPAKMVARDAELVTKAVIFDEPVKVFATARHSASAVVEDCR